MINVFYTCYPSQFSSEQWSKYANSLSQNLLEPIMRLTRWQDRQLALLGKLLLREALKNTGYSKDYLSELKYTMHGRPYLDLPLDFNISHAGDYVVCALTDTGKVGIDIELVHPIKFEDFRKVMSDEEWNQIHETADPLKAFFKYWAQKESVIKADGRGLSIPLDSIKINNEKVFLGDAAWLTQEININENYCTCIAYTVKQPLTLIKLSF